MATLTTPEGSPKNDISYKQLGGLKTPQAETTSVQMGQDGPSDITAASDNVTTGKASSMIAARQEGLSEKANASTQANEIMSEKSPLMRLAKQEGMLSAAKRGLGNSSIAAGASQAAMSKAAVPLAQQNASNAARVDSQNLANRQEASKLNVTERNDMTTTNVEAANKANLLDSTESNKQQTQYDDRVQQKAIVDATEENKAAMQKHSTDADVNQTWLNGQISQNMTHLQGQYNEILAASPAAAQMYGSTLDTLAGMWANEDIPLSIKNRYGESAMRFLEGGLRVQGSILGMTYRTDMPSANA